MADKEQQTGSEKTANERDRGSARQPLVGLLYNYSSTTHMASVLKTLSPGIRLEVAISGLNGLTEEERTTLRSVEILLTQPNLVKQFDLTYNLPNLKWMHSFAAGVDAIMKTVKPESFPPFILTRNCGYFDNQMAEYTIGMIIARERWFEEFRKNQSQHIWVKQISRSLSELSLGIVGFGSIGKEVARIAKAFGMTVWAVVRTMPLESEKCKAVDEYRSVTDIRDVFSSCDYILSILPSSPGTNGFFDGDVLSQCKTKKPVFMNIGRGNVINEASLFQALKEGWISHAVLDVFETEPLPSDSKLWTHPQITITPHVSGIRLREEPILQTFLENYGLYTKGKPLNYVVNWAKGY